MPYLTESASPYKYAPSASDPLYALQRVYEQNTPARLLAEQQAAIKAEEDAKKRAVLEATGLETLFPPRLAAATRRTDADMANVIRGYQDQVNRIDAQISNLVGQQDQFRSLSNPSKREELDKQIAELESRKDTLKETTRSLLKEDRADRPETGSAIRSQNVQAIDPRFTIPPDTFLENKASSILNSALDTGQQIARDQNRASTQGFFSDAREGVSSLFGDIGSGLGDVLTSPFFQRILAIMARPEFQDPRGIGPGIVGAVAGLKQDEAAAAKVKREEQRLANEAAQQEFLNKLRIAEARRGERSLQLKEEEATRVTPKSLEATKEQIKSTKSLLDDVPIAKQYIDNETGRLGIGKDRLKESVVIEALAIRAQSGNQLDLRQSIIKAVQNRTGATSQDTGSTPYARRNVTQER